MDILIKNIGGLPKDGDLTLTITPKGQVILGGCIFTSNFGKEVKAFALPEHHGRLIDADKILAERKKKEYSVWEWEYAYLRSAINSAPTIVEASNGTDS